MLFWFGSGVRSGGGQVAETIWPGEYHIWVSSPTASVTPSPPTGFLPVTPTHSCHRLAGALARRMLQKKSFYQARGVVMSCHDKSIIPLSTRLHWTVQEHHFEIYIPCKKRTTLFARVTLLFINKLKFSFIRSFVAWRERTLLSHTHCTFVNNVNPAEWEHPLCTESTYF